MKTISKVVHARHAMIIGYEDAPYRWYLFGYRRESPFIICVYRAPTLPVRIALRLILGSEWFKVQDPSFDEIEQTPPPPPAEVTQIPTKGVH